MNQRQDNLIAVLDLGSAWTRMLVAEVQEGALRYRGHGVVASAGMRKGLIADLAPAAKVVKATSELAERVARLNIDECIVGVGGPHIRGLNVSGGIDLGNRMREITQDDVNNVLNRARSIERPPDREFLHLLPREFILDDQPGIFDPVGMIGSRLEVDLHIATCSGSALQSTVTCANRAGLEVTDTVLESIAAAESTLTADERELGVCLLDIGAHSTELAVFFESAVVHTSCIPIGGLHFTNDLAQGLQITVQQAEELKCQYGHAVVTSVPQDAEIEIFNPESQKLRLRRIAEILEPRAEQLFYFVRESLRAGGVLEALGAGCVLTGGGAMLPGLHDIAESQIRVQARTGNPVRLSASQAPAALALPSFATAVGMLLYVHRTRSTFVVPQRGLRSKLRLLFASSY
jgi:cell division protein FtsA